MGRLSKNQTIGLIISIIAVSLDFLWIYGIKSGYRVASFGFGTSEFGDEIGRALLETFILLPILGIIFLTWVVWFAVKGKWIYSATTFALGTLLFLVSR